jgi:GDP-L-fucose synthase
VDILITGGSGFLGRHLAKTLMTQGHAVRSLSSQSCDLTKDGSLERLPHPAYDYIYHLAAWTRAGDFCLHHGGEQWIINQKINTNTLTWWQAQQPQAKLIALGTSVSYPTEINLTEDNYMQGVPNEKFYAYAMSKRMLYAGLVSLRKQFGLRYLYLVPSTLYGPGYHTDGRQMHFIFDLMRKIIRGKVCGEPVVLWGDGYQRREIIFVDDFIRIMLQLAETCENDLINIGAGEEFTIRHFARLICEKVGYDADAIQFDTTGYVGAKSKCLNIAKLKRLMPGLTLLPLEVGLAKTTNWFWAERERLRANCG